MSDYCLLHVGGAEDLGCSASVQRQFNSRHHTCSRRLRCLLLFRIVKGEKRHPRLGGWNVERWCHQVLNVKPEHQTHRHHRQLWAGWQVKPCCYCRLCHKTYPHAQLKFLWEKLFGLFVFVCVRRRTLPLKWINPHRSHVKLHREEPDRKSDPGTVKRI